MKKSQNKKVVLAFSGGLDTSFCVPYLMAQGYEVVTLTVDSGGFEPDEITDIAKKSKELGAIKHYFIDAKKYYFDSILSLIIKTNGLYEGSYPNLVSAQRYHIVEKCLEVAEKEGAEFIANGNSGMGNDQVRFNVTAKILNPEITVLEPIKEMGGNREEEKTFLKKKGFAIGDLHKKYSVNVSLAGITYSGSEIDDNLEPDGNIFKWVTGKKISDNQYITVEFQHGFPVKMNGKKLAGWQILDTLNKEVGQYGFGIDYYTGDCMIGIKGHLVFEAPGMLFLIKAHQALEQYVLSKPQIDFGKIVAGQMTEYIYNGKFCDPFVDNLKAFIESHQFHVSGTVKMKLANGNALPVTVSSNDSLIDPKVAMYAQSKSWTREEVDGFIKLYGLQSVIAAKIYKKGGKQYDS